MEAFRIIAPADENIIFRGDVPGNLQRYRMAGADALAASGAFGDILLHYFKGEGFGIGYDNYLLKKPILLEASSGGPALELQVAFVNTFNMWREGLGEIHLPEHQFEMTWVPYVHTQSNFAEPGDYHTFNLHLSKEILQPYAPHCVKLAEFLEKVGHGQPARLLNGVQFISNDMAHIIKSILNYSHPGGLTSVYFSALAHELLTLVTLQVAAITGIPKIPSMELNQAKEARRIILNDFEEYHTVEALARQTGTTKLKLQMSFKHLYGTTVIKFSRQARMEESYRLLQTTDYPLRVICMMVGYDDPSNFSVAFRNHFGYWPGQVLKRRKRVNMMQQ